jgi:hypothetical protein
MPKIAKPKPPTEIELTDLQEKYLATGDEAIWSQMFDIMIKYARSLTLKQNKGKVFLEPEHITAVATDAAIKIMERYKRGDGFRIDRSFGGLLRWKVIESLYGDYQEDIHLSLNHILSQDAGHSTELGDLQDKVGFNSFTNQHVYEPDMTESDVKTVQRTIHSVLSDYDDAVGSYRLWLLGRAYLLLNTRQSRIRQAPVLFKRILGVSQKEEEVLDLLLLEVRNRLAVITA